MVFNVLLAFYLFVVGVYVYAMRNNSLLRADPVAGQGTIVGHSGGGGRTLGSAEYEYTVAGQRYTGSFSSGVLTNGSPVAIFYSQSHPHVSSTSDPSQKPAASPIKGFFYLTAAFWLFCGPLIGFAPYMKRHA